MGGGGGTAAKGIICLVNAIPLFKLFVVVLDGGFSILLKILILF